MKITLYQIIPELDTDRLMFNNLRYMQIASGKDIPAHIYEAVYSGDVETDDVEGVFGTFNTDFPKDYRGRSMSVSDVLEVVESPHMSKFYYCDSVGFKEIEFDKSKSMMQIQNHDFQNTLKIKQDVRVFFIGNLGLEDHFCTKLVLQRCRYSECQLGYEIQFWVPGDAHPHTRQFLTKPLLVLTQCRLRFPDNLLVDKKGALIEKSKHTAHSIDILGIVSTWIVQSGYSFENL